MNNGQLSAVVIVNPSGTAYIVVYPNSMHLYRGVPSDALIDSATEQDKAPTRGHVGTRTNNLILALGGPS